MKKNLTKWDIKMIRAFEDISEGESTHSATEKWRLYEPNVIAEYPKWVEKEKDSYSI